MRSFETSRKTKETDVAVRIALDGSGRSDIKTGIGFFDHMLTALCAHGGLDLTVRAAGDLEVDCHHTVEDVGLVLGDALAGALGDRSGIERYGFFYAPMDESLALCAMDISGRPYLVFDCSFDRAKIGELETDMIAEFFRALAARAGITLHMKLLYGANDHHRAEALFKAFAHALKAAIRPARGAVLSTKGVLI
jgi:imidazoleglycerol-phosphate dehydratase